MPKITNSARKMESPWSSRKPKGVRGGVCEKGGRASARIASFLIRDILASGMK